MIACFSRNLIPNLYLFGLGRVGLFLVVLPQAEFIPASAQGLLMGGPYAVPKSNID